MESAFASDLGSDGLDRLLGGLAEAGSGPLHLPGIDEPIGASSYVRMVLTGARDRGWSFDRAFDSAINRLQPSQLGGVVDLTGVEDLREDRCLIEECRGLWRAAYEDREPTAREQAEATVGAWHRTEGFLGPVEKKAA